MKHNFIIAGLLVLFAQSANGSPLPRHFPPVNAYSAGVGYASVANPDDPSIILWNPAGMALIDQMSAEFSLAGPKAEQPSSWSILFSNTSGVQESRFGMGVVRRLSADDIGTFRSFEVIIPFSYGFGTNKLPLGLTMKYAAERYDDRDDWSSGLLFDVGMAWRISDGFTLGTSRLNAFGSALSSFPRESWLGAAIGNGKSPFVISAQTRFDRPSDIDFMKDNWSAGVRASIGENIPELRGGFLKRDGEVWFGGGVGWINTKSNTRIEYSLLAKNSNTGIKSHMLTYGYSLMPRSKRTDTHLSF